MGLIAEDTIQEVLGATDIVALVEGYFPLRRRGQDFWAVCPFHSETTPSFKVSPARQNYHCFGCGAHGTAIGFLMEFDHMDFVEATEPRPYSVIASADASAATPSGSGIRNSLMLSVFTAGLIAFLAFVRLKDPFLGIMFALLASRICKAWLALPMASSSISPASPSPGTI